MVTPLFIVCCFSFIIHFTEAGVYSMRLAGVRTKQVAIALSFVTSALLISRLSNMGQAPILGAMVDGAVLAGNATALASLEMEFRLVIFSAFLGSLVGALLTPSFVSLLQKGILRFLDNGSFLLTVASVFHPSRFCSVLRSFRLPRPSQCTGLSLATIPKTFLVLNVAVTAIYTIGVLCALLAGAYLPDFRATALQLSGIVNGVATILFATVVDPSGARITDKAVHGDRPESDVKSVVFFLLAGRLLGTLILAQVLLWPATVYIMKVTEWIATRFA